MSDSKERTLSRIFSLVRTISFLLVLVLLGYLVLATQNLAIISLIFMLILSLIIPFNSEKFDSWRAYQLNLIAPVLGFYVSLIFWFNNDVGLDFSAPSTIIITFIFAGISMSTIVLIHYYTREITVILDFEKDKFVHSSGTLIAVITLGAFVAFNVSDMSIMDPRNVGLVAIILGLYSFASTYSINSAYRRYKIDVALDVDDIKNKIHDLKEGLIEKFPNKPSEIDFLVYLLERMTSSFISGDYERCFIDAVTLIKDVTVVKTKPYRKKVLTEDEWNKFRKIRVALVHSELIENDENGKKVSRVLSEKEILEIKRKLYQSCVEVQKVAFQVVTEFSTTSPKTNKNVK